MKKYHIIGLITGGALCLVTAAWATTTDSSGDSPFCNPCDYLGEMYTQMLKQTPPLFTKENPSTQLFDTNNAKTNTLISTAAAQDTASNVTNSFKRFLYAAYFDASPTSSFLKNIKTADKKDFGDYVNYNSLARMTIGNDSGASDTLYMTTTTLPASEATSYQTQKAMVKKPNSLHDDYFSFSSLISPVSYTPEQLAAAKKYIKYAALSTDNLTQGIQFGQIMQHPGELAQLKQSSTYQNYVLTMRNLIATRSAIVNVLQSFIAERTPQSSLMKAINNKKKTGSASPLQVEAYQANHRVENKAWYSKINQESPVALEQTIAIELAEIEHQNYQAHLDREQLTAAVMSISLQANANNIESMVTQEATMMNTEIEKITNTTPPPSSNNPAPGS